MYADEQPPLKKRKVSPSSSDTESDCDVPRPRGLRVKRHSEKAKIPTRGSAFAAGYDLYRCVATPTEWLASG